MSGENERISIDCVDIFENIRISLNADCECQLIIDGRTLIHSAD